nr:exportin-T [Oncorhynchus nerka]
MFCPSGGKDGMAGFPDFIYKHIVPACFLAPLKPSFDLTDAQTVLTLSECALTLKMIHLRRGPEFIQYLQQEYLPSLQVSPDITQEVCQVLQQPDAKVLKNYMKAFFQRAKL